ncbi:cysteine hydrolase family protein [Bacillus pinisoli]|uniref:cysteine hydrolase family protein n=1 Tax=Bacillus pinisoli TaxID=2901866 RepID=UPI001FF119FE|nr:cysteine hydrolase family protein [Bacillus pinisoli]
MNRALIIIDVQDVFLDPTWGKRNNPEAETNIKRLLSEWRKRGSEVIYIQHISENPHSLFYFENESTQIKNIVKPLENEKIFTKQVNSAFIGTSLEDYLNIKKMTEVVITGLTTPHCVSTTTRMSANLGFKTFLLSDATAAFEQTDHRGHYVDADTIHHYSLATVHQEFATVLSTQDFIDNYLDS